MLDNNDFKNIFDAYFDSIRRYIFYRCGDMNIASDLAQDVFLKVWEKSDQLDADNIKNLLYKMAHDMFINNYVKEKRHSDFEQNMFINEDYDASPEDKMQFEELKSTYSDALDEMSETQRTIFLMSRNDGLKYSEIAEHLSISVKTVEKWMTVALKHLKTRLLID